MGAARMVVWAVVAALAWPVAHATAASLRKECRTSCGPAIAQCVAQGGRRRRCKRQTLRSCRREGLQVCVEVTTTSTPTTSSPAITSIPGATTSSTFGATTTSGGATSTAVGSTTSTPVPTTTSTTFPEVHGCTIDDAVDRSAPSADRTVTFAPYAYTPKCIRIAAGQTVTFSGTFAAHPLVGGEIVGLDAVPDASSPIPPTSTGSALGVVFESGGVFPFYCDFHGITQGMVGAVLVNP